jgi:3,4-dihydroxy 2-butanone 4-phosphate synthase
MDKIQRAVKDLHEGKVVLIFDADGRERETDMVVASERVTYQSIRTLRKDAGGLICTTVHGDIWKKLDLPYLAEMFNDVSCKYPILSKLAPNDLPYDTKSAFSITINHRKTFTGIPDRDRALTISEFAKLGGRAMSAPAQTVQKEFGDNFRTPGHVFLLNAREGLLDERFGHTELATALMTMNGIVPSATICEMMGDDGRSLPKEKAQDYAKRWGLCFLEGSEIIKAWKEWKAKE